MTQTIAQLHPKKVDVVLVNDDDESPSVLNPMSGGIFLTNRVGRRVFGLADGSRSVDDIVAQVRREFPGADESRVRQDVNAFITEGVQKGLIAWQEPGDR